MRAGLGPCVANEATGRSCQARFVWDRVGRTLTRFGRAYYKRFLCIRPQKAALRGRTLVLPGAGERRTQSRPPEAKAGKKTRARVVKTRAGGDA